MKPLFITLEGIEAAGKSTLIQALRQRLVQNSIPCITTREPGGCVHAEAIRNLLTQLDPWDSKAELLLFMAARKMHCLQTISPALEAGKWVLCDRFSDSTYAYQGYARGMDLNFMDQLHANLTIAKPDLTFVLDVDIEVSLARLQQRALSVPLEPFDQLEHSFYRKVQSGFREIVSKEPQRCYLIHAHGSTESIVEEVWSIIHKKMQSFLIKF
jgi:dTMP kinase